MDFLRPQSRLWACFLLALLLFIHTISSLQPETQHPLFTFPTTPANTQSRNYSVGFHLASSYAAAAVIIQGPGSNDLETLTWFTHGSAEYQQTMARLSLPSSEHLAPPYQDMQEYFDDIPRILARRALKKSGLPASRDVGVLSTVIKDLRRQIESALDITVIDAVVTTAHLFALYQDDVYDICEHAGFQYVEPRALYRPILWEAGAACAGYGINLCESYWNKTACWDEIRGMPDRDILEVHRSRTALTSTLATMLVPTSAFDPNMRRVEDFGLGSDAMGGYESEEQYWSAVKVALVGRMVEYPTMKRPEMIILTGDQVGDEGFRKVLEEAMVDVMGSVPDIRDDETMVIAAKGAAELSRRGADAPRPP